MIDRERFEQLAALAVTGEANAAERAELEAALVDEPKLADELLDMEDTDRSLRDAVEAPQRTVDPLPAHVVETLEQARREALAVRAVAEAKAGGADNVTTFAPPKRLQRALAVWLALAACLLLLAGLAVFVLPSRNSSKDIAVLAPRGATGFTEPTVAWDAKPGQKYDVWILPGNGGGNDAPALFVAKGVEPPLAFAELKPGPALQSEPSAPHALAAGQDYRLLVCLAGAGPIAGTAYPFHVAADASVGTPPASLAVAQNLANAGRTADALAVLASLPPEERARPEARALESDLRARINAPPDRN